MRWFFRVRHRLPALAILALLSGVFAPAAAEDREEIYPPASPRAQTDMPLPEGFFYDEKAQQYKKVVRATVERMGKDGKTRRQRVIRTTCYELRHETESSRYFHPVACRNL